jgi:hypothetical protein
MMSSPVTGIVSGAVGAVSGSFLVISSATVSMMAAASGAGACE